MRVPELAIRRSISEQRTKRLLREVASLKERYRKLPSEDFSGEAGKLRDRLRKGDNIHSVLPYAYALTREVAERTIGLSPYDTQILGAIHLYDGRIIEMQNGEGKTLTASLPASLAALGGRKVHIATYNEYLARRDAEWMGPIYNALGLSVGVIQPSSYAQARQEAYGCDITYGTHTDFIFDYLRDNLTSYEEHLLQRDLDYIILDEADYVLIDLARTPAHISDEYVHDIRFYVYVFNVARELILNVDFSLLPGKSVELTDEGIAKTERMLGIGIGNLYSTRYPGVAKQLSASLLALHRYERDGDYIVSDNQIVPIDDHTGRPKMGNKFSWGIHQALQAKEGFRPEPEQEVIAQISYQQFYKLYSKMAGMTATAEWCAHELHDVYGIEVITIPTHNQPVRKDYPDTVYKHGEDKIPGIIEEICDVHETGRPVLVGAQTIQEADRISGLLTQIGIAHEVLHAKEHEREAEIIKRAGERGAVTVTAKMAGRGTDIIIGEEVAALGGLHVIGVERNESRHIDMQLQGRAGRQGYPGSSRFYVATDDDVMKSSGVNQNIVNSRLFNSVWEDDMPIENRVMSLSIARAQARMEHYYSEQRQRAYDYDAVLDKQRTLIYRVRRKALVGQDISSDVMMIISNVATREAEKYWMGRLQSEVEATETLIQAFSNISPQADWSEIYIVKNRSRKDIENWLRGRLLYLYEARRSELGADLFARFERDLLVGCVDYCWVEHLRKLEGLQQETGLHSDVEEDQLEWYMSQSYIAFWEMIESLEMLFLLNLFTTPLKKGNDYAGTGVQALNEAREAKGVAADVPHATAMGALEGGGKS